MPQDTGSPMIPLLDRLKIIISGDQAKAGPVTLECASAAYLIGLGERVMESLARDKAGASVALLSVNADVIIIPSAESALHIEAQISRATRSVIFMSAHIRHDDKNIMTLTALYKLAPERVAPEKTADIA